MGKTAAKARKPKAETASNPETAPEPEGATHQAEDEAWATDGTDSAHLEDRVREIEPLEARIAELTVERDTALDKALRARADYDNLSRRTAEERAAVEQRASARVIGKFLDTYEILAKAAAEAEEAEGPDGPRAKGLRMAFKGMQETLRGEGLEETPGVGEAFDHHVHQAIAREPSDLPEGTVAEVIRAGYTLHGKLLREALVKVSAGPDDAAPAHADATPAKDAA